MRPIGVVENELAQCTLNHSILCMLCVQPQQIQVSLGTFWEIQRKLCWWSCLVYFSDWFIKWWEVECWLVNRKIAASRKRLTLPIRHKKGDTDKKCNICNKVHGTLLHYWQKQEIGLNICSESFVCKALLVSVEQKYDRVFLAPTKIVPEKYRNHFSQLDSLQFFKP